MRIPKNYKDNPNKYMDNPYKLPIIAREVLAVEYIDKEKSRAENVDPNDIWRHDFKSRVIAYGLPDGSVLLKSASGKKLWEIR